MTKTFDNIKDIQIRNSKSFAITGMIMCFIMSLFMAWMFWIKFPNDYKNLIAFIFFVLGILFFFWQYKDRSIKLKITKEGLWDYKKFYPWSEISNIESKYEVVSGSTHINLILTFNEELKRKNREINILGCNKSYSEIEMYSKTYKKLYDKRFSTLDEK